MLFGSTYICQNSSKPQQQQPTTPGDGDNPQNDAVQCPVCSLTLPSDNHRINTHLDSCLSQPRLSGTKRKLTQWTLLQLNFTRPDPHAPDYMLPKKLQFTESPIAVKDSAVITTASSPSELNVIGTDHHDIVDNVDDECDIFEVNLETLIVGRRYDSQKEVCAGDMVSLSRDSQNVKDPNAIKVVSEDSRGCSKFLGYLPRELTQHHHVPATTPCTQPYMPSAPPCITERLSSVHHQIHETLTSPRNRRQHLCPCSNIDDAPCTTAHLVTSIHPPPPPHDPPKTAIPKLTAVVAVSVCRLSAPPGYSSLHANSATAPTVKPSSGSSDTLSRLSSRPLGLALSPLIQFQPSPPFLTHPPSPSSYTVTFTLLFELIIYLWCYFGNRLLEKDRGMDLLFLLRGNVFFFFSCV